MVRSLASLATVAIVIAGCSGTPAGNTLATTAGASAAAPVGDPGKPSFELTLDGTVDLPAYASDKGGVARLLRQGCVRGLELHVRRR